MVVLAHLILLFTFYCSDNLLICYALIVMYKYGLLLFLLMKTPVSCDLGTVLILTKICFVLSSWLLRSRKRRRLHHQLKILEMLMTWYAFL